MKEPLISVGIVTSSIIEIKLIGEYYLKSKDLYFLHKLIFRNSQNGILLESSLGTYYVNESDVFVPFPPNNASFIVKSAKIGNNFHWERKTDNRYIGSFKIIREKGKLTLVNYISLENYIQSVIRSEINENAHIELLKAQAIVARSWTLAQLKREKRKSLYERRNKGEIIRWYERDGHINFNFCNDDHCQRYHGIGKSPSLNVMRAVEETRGLALFGPNGVCDARYSKSCGGKTELFENTWGIDETGCTQSIEDSDYPLELGGEDLSIERNAKKWILSRPDAFCNVTDNEILKTNLVDFDNETKDFFRWKIEYSQEEISEIIKEKLNRNYGAILDLIPVERGASGRLIKLKIVGQKHTMIIGKELEIRRALSKTHLYSSAIIIEKQNIVDGIPQKFVLHGAGWGHGVGMCQIGAAAMAVNGYAFDEILAQYFPNSKIKRYYK